MWATAHQMKPCLSVGGQGGRVQAVPVEFHNDAVDSFSVLSVKTEKIDFETPLTTNTPRPTL